MSTVSTVDSRKKSKSAPLVKRKSKQAMESKRSRRTMASNSMSLESNDLKYILDFGMYNKTVGSRYGYRFYN